MKRIRQYIVKGEVLKTGETFTHFKFPETHTRACTLLSKLTEYSWRRDYLEEVEPRFEHPKSRFQKQGGE
jgi:hypothetical protein